MCGASAPILLNDLCGVELLRLNKNLMWLPIARNLGALPALHTWVPGALLSTPASSSLP